MCMMCVAWCWLGNAPEPLAVDEELELVAIQGIHGQLDDNRDGAVDFSESDEVSSLFSPCNLDHMCMSEPSAMPVSSFPSLSLSPTPSLSHFNVML